MIEFSKKIVEKWALSEEMAERICRSYERGDSPFYLSEYSPHIAVELDLPTLWEVFDYLKEMENLSAKKKRALNALKKAGELNPVVENQVALSTKPYELDDLVVPLRPNPRSKGQVASKKGLKEIALKIALQEEEELSPEDMVADFVGTHPTLKSVADVVQGIKDILAEQFAFDETVRAMSREFVFEDGFFEVAPKSKKDPAFASYVGKLIPFNEVGKEELLGFLTAEEKKQIKLKVGVQLFRITELLRHHFIENPDSTAFDLICEVIDDMWVRLLHPVIEKDIKENLRKEAETWASKEIFSGLRVSLQESKNRGNLFVIDASPKKNVLIAAVSGQGNLLGATTEKKRPEKNVSASEKLRQFYQRHKPMQILLVENESVEMAEKLVEKLVNQENSVEVIKIKSERKKKLPSDSEYMAQNFAFLEPEMLHLYSLAILHLKPVNLVSKIGTAYYQVHPMQERLPEEQFIEIADRLLVQEELVKGISIKEILDSPLEKFKSLSSETLQEIKNKESEGQIFTKDDLLKVKGVSETAFRNISGFIVVPTAEAPLNRTTVHPDNFPVIDSISDQLNISIDTIMSNPDKIKSYDVDDASVKAYITTKLVSQIKVGQRFVTQAPPKIRRKLKLNEITEGVVVSGRVTNVTPFGVFVNINAVCDGLIHISQLADEFVETPDQVVSVGDKIDVRILKVDVKKRRISLSMKNLGNKAPKVRPSKGQLDNLADFFKNR
ncbi:Tex-like N-terminal domain-containing protein [Chitinispirillales bacterium ANBcel5]|uniref:S1 RNA-binding domain-containing protein n=1 Tax=Cellulosispirillum alkaliphilum TaxID=3039283 RepID=UPI002A52B5BE|nr:Tex-like N-terminal domain-containing protein [Chitinispirillales bacterium ANBcel5]